MRAGKRKPSQTTAVELLQDLRPLRRCASPLLFLSGSVFSFHARSL